MEIKERIDQVISRRQEQIPHLQQCLDSVCRIQDSITQVESMRETMLGNPEKYHVDSDVRDAVQSIQTNELRNAITLLIHDAAYERANLLMQTDHIHTCEICGSHICAPVPSSMTS